MMEKYQIVSNAAYLCGECPMWHEKKKMFLWSDVIAGSLYKFNPEDGSILQFAENKNVTGFTVNGENGLVCATRRGVYLWDSEKGYQLVKDMFGGELLSCGDAIADPKGRFLFGIKNFSADNCFTGYSLGKLLSMGKDGSISILEEGLHLPNGLGFSPDEKIFYYTDSVLRLIYACDYNAKKGTITNRRVFVKVPETEGMPDGMTVDAQGFVWSAQWYGSCIMRYDPDGKVERRIETPARQTSSVMFGGNDLTDLYVTTGAKSVTLNVAPKGYDFNAPDTGGPVYRYNFGIQGKPEYAADVRL